MSRGEDSFSSDSSSGNDSPLQQIKITKKITLQQRKDLIRASVDRLSQPKTYQHMYVRPPEKVERRNVRQIVATADRLSKHRTCTTHTARVPENRYMNRSFENITEINDRLYKEIKRKEAPGMNRGPKKPIRDMDTFITRMSRPKTYREREISRNVFIERRPIVQEEINELCLKLSDPETSRSRTPDTKRLTDKRFAPVNTYAWQGLGYKVPEYMARNIVQ